MKRRRPTPEELDTLTPEELAVFLTDWPATLVWSRVRDRRKAGRGKLDVDSGHVPATHEGMRELRRQMVGGRPPGTGPRSRPPWADLVKAARECEAFPSAERLALDLNVGQRTVERVAAGGPAEDGVGGGMAAVRVAAGRQ